MSDSDSDYEKQQKKKSSRRDKKKSSRNDDSKYSDSDDSDSSNDDDYDSNPSSVVPSLVVDHKLDEAVNNWTRSFKDQNNMSIAVTSYPAEPAFYDIDKVTDHTSIVACNTVVREGEKDKKWIGWKEALDDPTRRCWFFPFPKKIHTATTVRSIDIRCSYPANREYADLVVAGKALVTECEKENGDGMDTVGIIDLQKRMSEFKGDEYQMRIRQISVTSFHNPFPFSLVVTLMTESPVTGKMKSWCNLSQVSVSGRVHSCGSVYRIPAMTTCHDINHPMFIPPDNHTHPDFSRWINISETKVLRELKRLELPQKHILGATPYKLYKIHIDTSSVVSHVMMGHLAEIHHKTRLLPGIQQTEYDSIIKREEDSSMLAAGDIRFFYRIVTNVFLDVMERYWPFMKQDDYLMSISKGIFLRIAPDKESSSVLRDLETFQKNPQAVKYGSFGVGLCIEHESFDPDGSVLDDKKKVKKRQSKQLQNTVIAATKKLSNEETRGELIRKQEIQQQNTRTTTNVATAAARPQTNRSLVMN